MRHSVDSIEFVKKQNYVSVGDMQQAAGECSCSSCHMFQEHRRCQLEKTTHHRSDTSNIQRAMYVSLQRLLSRWPLREIFDDVKP